MKFKSFFCVLISAAILFSGIAAHATVLQHINSGPIVHDDGYAADETVTFIVEVEGDPALVSRQAQTMGAEDYIKTAEAKEAEAKILKKQADVVRDIANNVQADAKKGYTYTSLFNGFSVDGKFRDREAILALPGVKNVYISQKRYLPKPFLVSAGEQTGVPDAAKDYGWNGEGQVVAVIDSEFDTSHEFFAEPVDNPKYTKADIAKIIKEETMNVSVAANQVYKNSKIPFAFDYGCDDADTFDDTPDYIHGSHVAGIVAGKNGKGPEGSLMSGVAPGAQMILMKIGDRNGALLDAAILAALEDAVKFGVSAINMSFGSTYVPSSHQLNYQSVLSAARNAGIFLSASAGNESRGFREATPNVENIDYSSSGIPNGYSASTSIASVDNLFQYNETGKLILAGDNEIPYILAHSDSTFGTLFADKTLKYEYCGLGKPEDFEGLDLDGSIALVKRGEIDFTEKSDNAKAAGAEGIIIWNNADEYLQTYPLSLPGALVSPDVGQALYDEENKTVTVTDIVLEQIKPDNAGRPSSFTSWGTNETLELKPELSAPGGNIYSSVPNDEYQFMNGTSMAAPHVTGLVALMNQFYESKPFAEKYNDLVGNEKVSLFENLLMSSAKVIEDEDGVPYSPRHQGAGLANIKAAVSTPVILQGPDGKAKISLGPDIENNFALHFVVKNLTDNEVRYDKLTLDVLTDDYIKETDGQYYVGDMRRLTATAESNLSGSVTVPAGEEAQIDVKVTLDDEEMAANAEIFKNGFYIDGFVTLTSSEELPALSIPFTGFRGDWQSAPIFDTTIYDEGGSTLYIPNEKDAQGTFLYSGINETARALGRNPLTEENIVNREYIAFSPDGDGLFDTMSLNLQSLRSMSSLQLQIINEADECVLTDTHKSIAKFLQWKVPFENSDTLADGNYTLRVSGVYDYPGDEDGFDDWFELPITIDTQKPVVTEIQVEENKLTVTAKDNHFISGVAIGYVNDAGEEIWDTVAFDPLSEEEPNEFCTAEFNITGIDAEKISLEVYDYALNGRIGKLSDFTDDISIILTDFQQFLGMTAADFTVINRTETEADGVMLLAFYDADGRLTHMESKETKVLPGEETHSLRTAVNTENAVIMKLFFWDQITTMRPLIPAKAFDIQ